MAPKIALSSACFFPNTELAFEVAAEQGYDGIELMVNHDRRSQTVEAVQELIERFGLPVLSVHVPCLVITQHVWGWNPEVKLRRSVEMAQAVGAGVVVVHPPFRWQRDYAAAFAGLVDELHLAEDGPAVTVENMYTVDAVGRKVDPYLGASDDDFAGYPALTFDSSHAAAARRDLLELYSTMRGRVSHLHLSDSTASKGDEHLPVGMGVLDLGELTAALVADGFDGHVILEVALGRLPEGTRRSSAAECLSWARDAFAR